MLLCVRLYANIPQNFMHTITCPHVCISMLYVHPVFCLSLCLIQWLSVFELSLSMSTWLTVFFVSSHGLISGKLRPVFLSYLYVLFIWLFVFKTVYFFPTLLFLLLFSSFLLSYVCTSSPWLYFSFYYLPLSVPYSKLNLRTHLYLYVPTYLHQSVETHPIPCNHLSPNANWRQSLSTENRNSLPILPSIGLFKYKFIKNVQLQCSESKLKFLLDPTHALIALMGHRCSRPNGRIICTM